MSRQAYISLANYTLWSILQECWCRKGIAPARHHLPLWRSSFKNYLTFIKNGQVITSTNPEGWNKLKNLTGLNGGVSLQNVCIKLLPKGKNSSWKDVLRTAVYRDKMATDGGAPFCSHTCIPESIPNATSEGWLVTDRWNHLEKRSPVLPAQWGKRLSLLLALHKLPTIGQG